MPYRPVECNLSSLPTDRDRLPSGKQIIALTLTWVYICFWHKILVKTLDLLFFFIFFLSLNLCSYKFKLEDSAEIKPHVPLLNNRIYDNKFESQFYRISDSNKVHFFCLWKNISLIYLSHPMVVNLDVFFPLTVSLVLINSSSSFPCSVWIIVYFVICVFTLLKNTTLLMWENQRNYGSINYQLIEFLSRHHCDL